MAVSVTILSKIENLIKELVKANPGVHFYEIPDPEKIEEKDLKSEIIITDFDLIGPHINKLPNTKWLQGTWAGVDKLVPFINKSELPSFPIVRFAGESFGRITSEYVIANIVNHERKLFEVRQNQKKKIWSKDGQISEYRTIFDLAVGIIGQGSIGHRVGESLSKLGAIVYACGRRPSVPATADFSHISEYFRLDAMDLFLEACDYVITVLPKTSDTDKLLEKDILKHCQKRKAVLINIGRSNIISESALIKALDKKWLSAAILDVFDEEPLPSDSPLWERDDVIITPHVAAISRAKDFARQFRINLKYYQQKRTIPGTVDFIKGY